MTQPPPFRPKSIFEPLVRGPRGPRGSGGGTVGPAGPPGSPGADGTGIVWRGAWSGATTYAVNDAVSSGGSAYICILAHTNHVPPNGTYWGLLAAKGDAGAAGSPGADGSDGADGAAGTSFIWRGPWASGTAYVANDAVERDGSAWMCILAHTNHVPPNGTYWNLMAQKGADGDPGTPGDTRPAGFGVSYDGGASHLTLTGTIRVLSPPLPYNGTIAQASIAVLSGPGSATVGIKKCAAGGFPGSLADITGGHDLVITAADEHLDSVLTDWDLDVAIGDRVLWELKAVDGVVTFVDVFLTLS